MNYLDENTRTGREILPDLVRAFALLGIILVNVAYIAYPAELTYDAGGKNTALDSIADFGVNALFLFKSYSLFSFMFGVGIAHQIMASERHGISFTGNYMRRMVGLVILGILHVSLAFLGDILIIYGLLGMVLFFCRNRSQKFLLTTGIAMFAVQIFVAGIFALSLYLGETYEPDEMVKSIAALYQSAEMSYRVYSEGTFTEVMIQRWRDWVGMIVFAAPLQAPGVLGFFLIGLATAKSGVLAKPESPFWSKSRRVYLPTGVLLSVIGAYVYSVSPSPASSTALIGIALLLFAAPFSSMGYIGLLARWSQGPTSKFKVFVARGGTASLTAYLLQSLVLSLIFCGYAFGLYREIGALACIAIAFLTGLATIVFASLWRIWFKRGPMEVLLRSWTYLGQK